MQSAVKIAVSACFFTSVLAAMHQNSAKLRRDGVLNLYPFPRVGRGSPQQTWELPFNDLYIEYKPTPKRQLYAFPRVGRSEVLPANIQLPAGLEQILLESARSHAFSKRGSESTDSNGMWFGPRLGRSFKEDFENDQRRPYDQESPIHHEMKNDISEPEQMAQTDQVDAREKRQAV